MTFPFHQYFVLPSPGQPEGIVYRPMIPIEVQGPADKAVVMALVDTGSDVTILPAFVLGLIGAKYDADEVAQFRGVGGQLVQAHYSRIQLGLDHPTGRYTWPTKVGFLDGAQVAILGFQGFLEFFNASFNSDRKQLRLKPIRQFPGEFSE